MIPINTSANSWTSWYNSYETQVIYSLHISMIILLGLAVVAVLGLLGYAATRPDTFSVERTTAIQAPPSEIFPLIHDFHSWASWSPYEKLDPLMKKTYSGAPSGKGAVYEWDGSSKAGAGRMEIIEVSVPSKILIKLDFSRPFKSSNTSEFTLVARDGVTSITWAMHGPSPFFSKVIGMFMNMDTLVGRDFEMGLANLKTLAEK